MKFAPLHFLQWVWANTDSISKWAQIAALIVAGYWTYVKFIKTEAPSLETAARLQFSDLKVYPTGDSCRLKIRAIMHNDGHTIFWLRRFQIQGWRSEAPRAAGGNPAYFDVNKMLQGERVLNADPPPDLILNQKYTPGSSIDQDFSWDIKPLDGLYMFVIDATVYDDKGKYLSEARQWNQYSSCKKTYAEP
jgi:hypothetical protein